MGNQSSVLITGGTGHIGSQLSAHFLCQGWTVIVPTREQLSAVDFSVRLQLPSAGRLHVIQSDLQDEAAAGQIISFLDQRKIRPRGLVNAARSLKHLELDDEGRPSRSVWISEYLLDVIVPYELSLALADQTDSQLKAIVNIASIYGIVAPNRELYDDVRRESPIQYGTAKAALIHLTRELAVRLSDRKIRVNAVSFGGVAGRAGKEFMAHYGRLCPSRRMLAAGDAAGPVEFLLSDASGGMPGHNLVVDGGWTVW